jgi:glycosyltransferase involved in cell wall biosynthesis
MRICLISVEIFAWGKYGGFGRATRTIGRELAKRGHEVFAVVPRRKGQAKLEILDGIKVFGFSPFAPWQARKFLIEADADIYHSCEPSLATYFAMNALPHKKHMVTFRDPRDSIDWKMELQLPSLNKLQVISNYLYENNYLVRNCIKDADAVYTIGEYLIPKVKKMYDPDFDPKFLPTPVAVPKSVEKATEPTVCYMARMDRRKRPQLFLDLAEKFPEVKFIAVGKSRHKEWDAYLRQKYQDVPNLEMTGFIDQFSSDRHSKILEKSWIMVNCATREALPNSFIESAAQGCAILSSVDPDNFASKFGYRVSDDDFATGLAFLLENDNWRRCGQRGYEYVKETFEVERAIDLHLDAYRRLLSA